MPLARIIASTATDCGDLETELRARGFEIQKIGPEENPAQPADLEISLEEYPVEEVLGRAAEAAQANDVSVFIAPGAITDAPRPMQVIRLQPGVSMASAPSVVEEIHLNALAEPALEAPKAQPMEAEPVLNLSQEELPAVLASTPVAMPLSEFQELVAELESVVPAIEQPVAQDDAEALSSEVPGEEVIAEDFAEPALSVMEDTDSWEEEPVSDWPLWNPPLNDDLVEPVVLQHDLAASAAGEPSPVAPASERSPLMTRWFAGISPLAARLGADRRLFWRLATVSGIVAVTLVLFGASWHRRSPLPAQLTPAAQASAPLPAEAVTPASHVNVQQPDRSSDAPLPLKQVVARRRLTDYADEANLVAPDTVVRFDRPAAKVVPKRMARRKPMPRRSGQDIVAKDTVVRYSTNSQPKE
jgi:hypothetical protein